MPLLLHNLPWLVTALIVIIASATRNFWALPGDAALAALAHTGWFGLICAVVIFGFRRWPQWCDDAAARFPAYAWRVLLPTMTGVPTKASHQPQGARMGMKSWIAHVNDKPQTVPHVVFVGGSGYGKTTTATVTLSLREGEIVIITGKDGDAWGGLTAIGIDDDLSYTTVAKTFAELHQELKRRQVAAKHGNDPGVYLNIVLDDFSTLQKAHKPAIETVKVVWRIGRSLKVRLVMLTDSTEVESIGLAGEGEARTNACYIELRENQSTADMYRVDKRGNAISRQPIDVRNMDKLVKQVDLTGRAWDQPLTALPSSAGHVTPPLVVPVAVPASGKRPISDDDLRKFKQAGTFTRDDVHALGYQFRDERWTAA